MIPIMKDWITRRILEEGSTRSLALLRVGLVLCAWSRFSSELIFYRLKEPMWALISISFFASTSLLLIGMKTRFTALWAAGTLLFMVFGLGYWQGHEPWRHHHIWLIVSEMALLSLTPCGRSFSWDRWRESVKVYPRGPPPERGPIWGLRLMALQVSAVYFWGAFDKTNWAYLSGARLEHHLLRHYLGADLPDFYGFSLLMMFLGTGSVLLEYVLGFGLWFRRWQIPLMALGAVFHILLYLMLPVATFSATMVLLYIAYFSPQRVHIWMDRVMGR